MQHLRRLIPWVLVLAVTTELHAQNSECAGFSGQSLNLCNAAVDGSVIFQPVFGLLVSGGNPVLGTARMRGGFPHASLTLRVNGSDVQLPDLSYDGSTTTVPAGQQIFAPSPVIEASLGLFGGLSGGFLALDALGSVQLLPTSQINGLTVDPGASKIGDIALGFGFGGKVGVLAGGGAVPAVSVSAMRRNIPRLAYGNVAAGDAYAYSMDVHAWNVRAVAGYKLSLLSLTAGLGWNNYTGDALIDFTDPITGTSQPRIDKRLDQSRTMAFADLGLDFPVLKIVGEAGYQFGQSQNLVTTFENNNPSDNRFFASVGLRFSF